MANIDLKRKENIAGNFFVDNNCINCGSCYWIAPNVFCEQNGKSAVYRQPDTLEHEVYRALYACPVQAIGAINLDAQLKNLHLHYPHDIEAGVFYTGFHAEASYGATSYFIERENGNILIDSPRYVKFLAHQLDSRGGIAYHLLSHRDDIADTDEYWKLFQGTRCIHHLDVSSKTSHYEQIFQGQDEIRLCEDLLVIPVPGHTKGSVCYLYKNKFLFSGDHLAYSTTLNHLYAFRTACWYNFEVQIKSMEKLLDYEFEYVLPGHGSPVHMPADEMRISLKTCILWMKQNN